jgi:hypothetical protein
MYDSTTTMENNMEASLKTKHWSAIWSSNTTPGDIPKGMRLRLFQSHLPTHVYFSTIHNSQAMETANTTHYQWMD